MRRRWLKLCGKEDWAEMEMGVLYLLQDAGRREEFQHITADHKRGCFLLGGTEIPAGTCKHSRDSKDISAFISWGMLRFHIRHHIKQNAANVSGSTEVREHGECPILMALSVGTDGGHKNHIYMEIWMLVTWHQTLLFSRSKQISLERNIFDAWFCVYLILWNLCKRFIRTQRIISAVEAHVAHVGHFKTSRCEQHKSS